MTSSLVGSEMCIRDRNNEFPALAIDDDTKSLSEHELDQVLGFLTGFMDPVSYTHLTLPTICSV
eukprot:2969162-Prorocentrum_lima.AAC.1